MNSDLVKNTVAYSGYDYYQSQKAEVSLVVNNAVPVFISEQVKGLLSNWVNKNVGSNQVPPIAYDALYDALAFYGYNKFMGINVSETELAKKIILSKLGVYAYDQYVKPK